MLGKGHERGPIVATLLGVIMASPLIPTPCRRIVTRHDFPVAGNSAGITGAVLSLQFKKALSHLTSDF